MIGSLRITWIIRLARYPPQYSDELPGHAIVQAVDWPYRPYELPQ